MWRIYFRSNLMKYLYKSNGACFIVIYKWVSFIKTHQILIQIEWDLFHCVLEEKSFDMNSCWFFWVFCRNFIVRAWICGCSSYVHQVWQFEKLWTISRLEYKYITHSYEYSNLHKYFTTCKFQVIFLWPFTSPQACNWWIFESL